MNKIRKVLFTNGMLSDCMIILTNAPKDEIEKWCYRHNEEIENGINTYFDTLKTMYYVKELIDSEIDEMDRELINIIGYDEVYDLGDYYE